MQLVVRTDRLARDIGRFRDRLRLAVLSAVVAEEPVVKGLPASSLLSRTGTAPGRFGSHEDESAP